tara:strand:- start:1237 stop:1461 length:225 start_codon:yes stop_codon:yes gene_type:complete
MFMSFMLGLLSAAMVYCIIYCKQNYKKQNTNVIVVMEKAPTGDDVRAKVIDGLSRKKLIFSSSEQCWVKRNQID